MRIGDSKGLESYRNFRNNGYGKNFEKMIEMACNYYRFIGVADIAKVDEAFRVIRLFKGGRFEGQFTKKAEPDFQGTLENGKSICFEAKYTTTNRIKKSVITENQFKVLDRKYKLGAVSGVCVGIQERYFFVPWDYWRDMEKHTGKKSASCDDLKDYEVFFKHGINFLNK